MATRREHQLLLRSFFLLLFFTSTTVVHSLSIGVNYGTLANNLPPPTQVAAFLRDNTFITSVKLFDSNPDMIRAFANTPISVTITVPNGLIPSLAKLPAARQWLASNVLPFTPATNITLLAVGNEILATSDKNLIAHLVPAMRALHAALLESHLPHIRVSTPHSLGILSASEPPSTGRFRRVYDKVIFAPMLDFHRKTNTPFLVNPYPYFGYTAKTLNYALFQPNSGIHDRATGITYTNMFEAQMDAVHCAMKRLGYGDVEIAVGETGWPSEGEKGQVGVSVEDARDYNGNLIRHVNSGKGTPLMPNRSFEVYLFALFNENLKPGPAAERNWGLFNADLSPVYDVGILRAGAVKPSPRSGAKKWCVAKEGTSVAALQANLDYVCSNGIDCKPIQAGGSCFAPNTIQSHASYAMNAYYQSKGRHNFDCQFGQTGVITSSDPSYSGCRYDS